MRGETTGEIKGEANGFAASSLCPLRRCWCAVADGGARKDEEVEEEEEEEEEAAEEGEEEGTMKGEDGGTTRKGVEEGGGMEGEEAVSAGRARSCSTVDAWLRSVLECVRRCMLRSAATGLRGKMPCTLCADCEVWRVVVGGGARWLFCMLSVVWVWVWLPLWLGSKL
jgi:hypothetical protein